MFSTLSIARVYGGDLSALCESQGVFIPTFVTQFMEYIEEVGIGVRGIYRMSGNKKEIAKLRAAIETGMYKCFNTFELTE